MLNVAYT